MRMTDSQDERLQQLVDGELGGVEARAAEDALSDDERRQLRALRALRGQLGTLREVTLPAGFEARLQARLHGEEARTWRWQRLWDALRFPLVLGTAVAAGALVMVLQPPPSGEAAHGVAASGLMGVPSGTYEVTWRLRAGPADVARVLDTARQAGLEVGVPSAARDGVRTVEVLCPSADARRAAAAVEAVMPLEVRGMPAGDGAVRLRVVFTEP